MSIDIVRTAIGAAALSLTLTPGWAQQGSPQMAGMAQGGGAAMCAQNSGGVTRAIDVAYGRIEDARQTNDASKLRAAIADLQILLAQMKAQLVDCVALAGEAGGGAMGNMAGMDRSKMQMAPGTPVVQPGSPSPAPSAAGGGSATAGMDHSKTAGMDHSKMAVTDQPKANGTDHTQMAGMDHSKMPAARKSAKTSGSGGSAKAAAPATGMDHSKMGASSAKANPAEPSKMAGMDHSKMTGEKVAPAAGETSSKDAQAAAVVFTVRTDPAPPRSGKNDFDVTLKDAEGKPIADAEVSLAFYMPPIPAMNMPEMRTTAQLTSAGNGVYKGSGTMGMAGDWDVTITASRKGQTLGTKKMKLTAK